MQIKINLLLVVPQTKVYIGKYFTMNNSCSAEEVISYARAIVPGGLDQ
ncbi:MAG: hypothetical protein IH795_00520 [Bacteroidetes bacterium]|nr:hypothetical protein [Bacteroidota bacterium]